MILRCTFEELATLAAGSERLRVSVGSEGAVVAPPELVAEVEALLPRLRGDLSVTTLAEARRLGNAVAVVLDCLKDRMDRSVLEQYVGAEDAVHAYFEYAHVLTIENRLRQLGDEMAAIIELMTGAPPTPETARSITFPD